MQRLHDRVRPSELTAVLIALRRGIGGVAMLSAVINVLVLSGSIYLMLVYDRVLPSQSGATLLALLLMVSVAYLFHGLFDAMRSHMLSDIGAALDERLARRVQRLDFDLALRRPAGSGRVSPVRDLEQIRSFLSGPGPSSLIDLPWIGFFLLILSMVNVWLGLATLAGVVALAAITWTTDRVSRARVAELTDLSIEHNVGREATRRHAELVAALGMRERLLDRAAATHGRFHAAQRQLSELTASLGGAGKVFRLFLQSAVLSVGALLVIDGKASAGIIFASSVLAGRALAPVDQAIANWRGFVAAQQSWARLDQMLTMPTPTVPATALPAPERTLAVRRLTLAPPGSQRMAVADATFDAKAGDAIGIVGPSAVGKSSLLRGILGLWLPTHGEVRLDGASIDQWDPDALGRHFGYLPQTVELFAGTIADNIARFDPEATSERVIAAAEAAGVHQLIVGLPGGYNMVVGEDGAELSAGQRQRIALARALYGDPFLVVLDEPNSNLDPEGEQSLAAAIDGVRARGGIVLMVAHRLAILGRVNLVLAMRDGRVQAFGPRDDVLSRKLRPAAGAGSKLTVVAERDG